MNGEERKDYEVEWNAHGIAFNYNGKVKVWALDESDVKERAMREGSRKLVMSPPVD
ncbi:hypothetical protein DFR56_12250 [Pseudogracilibacillus auburnensis]|uniref:Uncharacterized protein n=1 Tax=Pseudogracilibacillus auburnensis TaxID=1494959 RepID=A0A2V3VIT1_9BACI|nr:hypothetical protein DFR56_12250 [Pseudogracilibacillus auburnensis]